MITQEEVKIRLGVDASAVAAGIAPVNHVFTNFIHHTGKKLMELARANVYMAGADLIRQILPTADEFWSKIYGVDEETTKQFKEANERLHKLRDEVLKTAATLDKAYEERNLREADNSGKEAIFESNLQTNQQELEKAKLILKAKREGRGSAEEIGTAQKKVNELLLEQLGIEKQLSEVRGQMTTKELRESIRRRANRKEDVDRLRSDYKTNLELGNLTDAEQNKQDIARIIAQRSVLEGLPPGVDVNAFLRSTNPNMPYVPSGADNAKATYDAFTKAIKENTLYVLVKGVEGE